MTQKIHGAAYPGVWVERKVAFIKLVFNKDISALAAADLVVLGTATPAGVGTVADSTFAVVESALVQALKTLELKSTVLAVSEYNATAKSVDVMLGNAEGWFSDVNGAIVGSDGVTPLPPLPVLNAQAVVTTAGAAPTNVVGALVGVAPGAVQFLMEFVYMDGNMTVATGIGANAPLALGPGASSGAVPINSPTGTPGYYPKTV